MKKSKDDEKVLRKKVLAQVNCEIANAKKIAERYRKDIALYKYVEKNDLWNLLDEEEKQILYTVAASEGKSIRVMASEINMSKTKFARKLKNLRDRFLKNR